MKADPRPDAIELLDAAVAGMGGERRDGQHVLALAVGDADRLVRGGQGIAIGHFPQ